MALVKQDRRDVLLEAIKCGDLPRIKENLPQVQETLPRGSEQPTVELRELGTFLLLSAAQYGKHELVAWFLDLGAPVNGTIFYGGWTALHFAARFGHLKVVEILLERNAEPDVADNNGVKPLYLAAMENHIPLVELLLKRVDEPTARNIFGASPLHHLKGDKTEELRLMELLLDSGADPNAADWQKSTPLQCATTKGDFAKVELLLSQGADPNIIAWGNQTALHWAALTGHVPIVTSLLCNAADPNILDGEGEPPLSTALLRASIQDDGVEVVKLLLSKGADPTTQSCHGLTPLQFAGKFGVIGVVVPLLNEGADPTVKDNRGKTALKYAIDKKFLSVALVLLETLETQRSARDTPVLMPEVALLLESNGILNPAEDEDAKTLNLDLSTLLDELDPPETPSSITIPKQLYSIETYEFLGYTPEVAKQVWENNSRIQDPAQGFFKAAVEHYKGSFPSDNDDWDEYMTTIGISSELRSAILLEEYDDLRRTQSCKSWLENAMDNRMLELQYINSSLLKLQKGFTQRGAAGGSNTSASQHGQRGIHPNGKGSSLTGSNAGKTPAGSSSKADKNVSVQDSQSQAVSKGQSELEDKVLWRGGTALKINQSVSEGKLDVRRISSAPGDFSGRVRVPYFSPQRKTAEHYSCYQRHLAGAFGNWSATKVLKITVTSSWLKTLTPVELLSSKDKWKEVVFECRLGSPVTRFLEEKNVDYITGHIALCHDEDVQKMTSFQNITDEMIYKIDNDFALQWAFVSDRALDELSNNVAKTEIEGILGKLNMDTNTNYEGKIKLSDIRLTYPTASQAAPSMNI